MANPFDQFDQAPQGGGLVIDITPTDKPKQTANPFDQFDAAETGTLPRLVGQGAQGTNDAIANTVGAPVDLVAAGLRKLGLDVNNPVGGSQSLKGGIDYVATLPGRVGDAVSQRSLSPFSEDRTSRFEAQGRGEKIANATGEGLGTVLATMLPAGAIARAATPGTVTQGVAEALASQPKTQIASGLIGGGTTGATDSPAAGLAAALLTPAATAVGGRLVSPVTNQLSGQERNLATAAEKAGITLTPAQQTGSKGLRMLEETMARTPLAAGPMRGAFENQRGQFNSAVLEKAGITADNANPETLARAFQQQGKTFNDLAARTSATFDKTFANDVGDTVQKYANRLDTNVAPIFKSYLKDVLETVGNSTSLTGEKYANIRSDITRTIRENQSNPSLQRALGGLVDSLDGAMERSASPQLAAEWKDARRQYQALMTVDKAMSGGTAEARTTGDIPFGALTSAVRSGDKAGFARGRGQLNELSRVGDYLANKVPNSGTPERLMVQNLLTGGALFGGTAATGVGLPAAAAAAAAPYAISKLYNSPVGRAYLTNELAGRVSVPTAVGQQGVQQSLQIPGGDNAVLARLLMRANERRVGGR